MRALVIGLALLCAPQPARPEDGAESEALQRARQIIGTYRLKGSIAVRPSAIGDDGTRTYIEWPADEAMPATFAISDDGGEQVVDGYVRGGLFTIDDVHSRLVFRRNGLMAEARRNAESGR